MKKKITAVLLSVFICLTPLAVSADTYRSAECYSGTNVRHLSKKEYSRAVGIVGTEYDAKLAEKVISCLDKRSDKVVIFKKSLAKKALEKVYARADAINSGDENAMKEGFFNAAVGKDYVVCEGRKNGKAFQIAEYGMAYYLENGRSTAVTLDDDMKLTRVCSTAEYKALLKERELKMGINIPDMLAAYVFSFSHNGADYTLEIFKDSTASLGFLIGPGGNIAGMYSSDIGFRVMEVSFSPDEKLFKVPSCFKEVDTPWLAAKEWLGAEYDTKYADLAYKASHIAEKSKPREETDYKNSLTKKFVGKLSKRVSSGKDYLYAEYNGDDMKIYARYGKKLLLFDDLSYHIFADGKKAYDLYTEEKAREEFEISEDEYNELIEFAKPDLGFKTPVKEKISVYKFSFGGKSYTYELFTQDGRKFGTLFDENGSVTGRYSPDGFVFIIYKNASAASVFNEIEKYEIIETL